MFEDATLTLIAPPIIDQFEPTISGGTFDPSWVALGFASTYHGQCFELLGQCFELLGPVFQPIHRITIQRYELNNLLYNVHVWN